MHLLHGSPRAVQDKIKIQIMELYHILNRGVEKKNIFLNNKDYQRFTNNLWGLNNQKNVLSYFNRNKQLHDSWGAVQQIKLVNILCWCLMPNHHHVEFIENIKNGASIFSQKLTSSHTQYFNLKNNRSGVLFQGKSKIIQIEKNEHFRFLPYYIMTNPIKLIEPEWKEKGIKNIKKTIEFLENYKYSSFPDLIGKKNFPETINKKSFYEIYDTNEIKFKKDFSEWLFSHGSPRAVEFRKKEYEIKRQYSRPLQA